MARYVHGVENIAELLGVSRQRAHQLLTGSRLWGKRIGRSWVTTNHQICLYKNRREAWFQSRGTTQERWRAGKFTMEGKI